jgi:hypothetical protein
MSVVKTISLLLGDQEALETKRVKYRSSMGRGRAAGLDSESSDSASEIWRVSGPEDCAKQEAQSERTNRQRNVVRSEFIVTSVERQGGLRPRKQQADCTPGRDCDCTSRRFEPLFRVGRLAAQPERSPGKHAARLRERHAKRVYGTSRTRSRKESWPPAESGPRPSASCGPCSTASRNDLPPWCPRRPKIKREWY